MLGLVAFVVSIGPVEYARYQPRLIGNGLADLAIRALVHLLGPCGFLCRAWDVLLAVHTDAPSYQVKRFSHGMFEADHWLEVMGRSIKWERGLRRLVEEVNRR